MFEDLDGNVLNVDVKQADDTILPSWLNFETIFPLNLIGTYGAPDYATGVSVVGDYAYVVSDFYDLHIVDVSNPSSPSLVGTCADVHGRGIYVADNYAYVLDGWDLRIIDISNPSSPNSVGVCGTPDLPYGVFVVGNYAYVADRDSGLQIIDVSTPSSPMIVGSCGTPGWAYGVYVVGNLAFVADGSAGLQIIDINTPSNPSIVGSCNAGWNHGVYVVGNYAYMLEDCCLRVVDISIPSNPSLVGTYDALYWAKKVYIVGNYAYVADDSAGLRIIDVNIPSNPKLVETYNMSGEANDVFVADNYAYIADDNSGLQIIKIDETIRLNGTPSVSDAGILSLNAIASDGVANVSAPFSISVLKPPPTISNFQVLGIEDIKIAFNATDFEIHFSDFMDDGLDKIQITSLPTNSILKLSGVSVTLDQEIDVGDLGDLTFEPDENWYGQTSFSWKGYDGSDYSVASASVNITISSVNDVPVLSELSKSGSEDKVVTFSAEDFIDHFSDVEGDDLIKIQIMSLPANGVLKLLETPVTLDQEIDVDDLDSLTFEPRKNWYGKTSFDWRGYDGVDYSEAVSVEIFIDEVDTKKSKDNTITDWMIWSAAGAIGAVAATTAIITTAIIVMKKKGLACFGKSNADIELKDRKEFDRVELYTSWSADGDDGKDV